jgi:DNA helicase-2/ATP-dependent DNA helicase PcrA
VKKYRLHSTSVVSRIDFAADLNEEQRAVVTRGFGPALVIAGAGSGKTRTITYRVGWLLEQGVPPSSVLLMTFTNKAAREMLGRVDALTGGEAARKIRGGTFHHVANVLLRRFAGRLGFGPDFTILDPEDRNDLMQSVLGECATAWRQRGELGGKDPLTEKRFPAAGVLGTMVSSAVNRQKNLTDVLAEHHPYFSHLAPLVAEVAIAFAKRKRERNLMDFDDLLLYWKRLLELDEGAREAMRSEYRHVLVDEYQDTNKLQADIIDLLGAPSGNVMVVGDDCQSIYSFRGAHFANIMEFPSRYPGCSVHKLETNYRSTPQILALANAVIQRNVRQHPKVLHASRPDGDRPGLVPARDVEQQAHFIAQRVLELRDEGVPLGELAILYRAHSDSLEMQVELARRGIPYDVRSGLRFFERGHIKDVLAHLRVVENPRDEVAWVRVARLFPKIGTVTADRIWSFIAAGPVEGLRARMESPEAEHAVPQAARPSWAKIREIYVRLSDPRVAEKPGDLIETVIAGEYLNTLQASYADPGARLDDLHRLASFAATFPDTAAFLADVTLITELTADDDDASSDPEERLTLSTVHRAKGLEWRGVFVLWAAENHFPSVMGLKDDEGEEEERRLFYVAITRAKDELYLVYPGLEIRRDGRTNLLRASRFLQELERPHPYEVWQLEESAIPALGSGGRR